MIDDNRRRPDTDDILLCQMDAFRSVLYPGIGTKNRNVFAAFAFHGQ